MIENMIAGFYMLGLLGIVIIVNTVLGIILANKKLKFNWKKLWAGLGKAIIIIVCMSLFCLSLELVPSVLEQIDINIPNDLITVLELILMIFTAYKKYALDCFDKFKTILNVKEGE